MPVKENHVSTNVSISAQMGSTEVLTAVTILAAVFDGAEVLGIVTVSARIIGPPLCWWLHGPYV